MKYVLTQHAADVLEERGISLPWLERVLTMPDKIEPDSNDPQLVHYLGKISEHEDRVLRVIFNAGTDPARVVTAYFDRKMRGQI